MKLLTVTASCIEVHSKQCLYDAVGVTDAQAQQRHSITKTQTKRLHLLFAKKFESFCVCLGERAAPDMQQQQRPGSARNSIIASQAGGTAGRASLITNARLSVVNRADSRHGPPKRSALGSVVAVNALTSAAAAKEKERRQAWPQLPR
jgi:hypothetical protein